MRFFSAICLLAFAATSFAQTDWTRYRLKVSDANEAQRLTDSDVTLFSESVAIGETDIVIGPGEQYKLWALALPYQRISTLPNPIGWDRHARPKSLNYRDNYYRYDEIISQYEEWRLQYPQHVKRFQIGTSIQGRPIWAYSVRQNALFSGARRSFLVICGIHAREWVSPAVGMHVFKKTIESASVGFVDLTTDLSKRAMLRGSTFYFVPVNNPDGYEYSWTNNRLWRKNRRANSGGSYGVDLNRNFAKGWGGSGSSGNQSSSTYRGTAPFSEPEAAAHIFLANRIPRIDAMIDFHSYSEKILWPWSYTTTVPAGNAWLTASGNAMRDAGAATHGHTYGVGQGSLALYVASGTTKDWFYDQSNAASYTVELRDTGEYGFLLPENQISPTQDEGWAIFSALALRMTNR